MNLEQTKNVIEAALLAAGRPLNMEALLALFDTTQAHPGRERVRQALQRLEEEFEGRGIELKEVASGFRIQVRPEYADWIARLWTERPARYTRALLETLVLIAYRQPITRGEIEDIRGVAVSSNITKTLLEREWVRVVGHRDVPGKPVMFGTTRQFLDHFNLKSLADLPPLSEIKDIAAITGDLFEQAGLDDGEVLSIAIDEAEEDAASEDAEAEHLLGEQDAETA